VQLANPTIFEYQVQDDQGLANRTAVYAAYDGATETVDALLGAWSEIGGLLDAIIDGRIVGGRITIPTEPNVAWKSVADSGNNANQIMALSFENDFNRYLTTIVVPSYKEAVLTAEKVPDLANVALAAFVSAIIDDLGTVFYQSRDLHQIDALRKAYLSTRGVKGQRRDTEVIPSA
jgi:hypothetical protein